MRVLADDGKILSSYKKTNNVAKTAIETGFSESTVRRSLKRAGISFKNMNAGLFFTDEEKRQIIKEYQCGFSTVEIAKHFEKVQCDRTVATYLRKWGIPIRQVGQRPRIEHEDFFESIDTEIKAYFFGFIMADGCVREKNGRYTLSFELTAEDGYMVERLIKELGYYVTNKDRRSDENQSHILKRASIGHKNMNRNPTVSAVFYSKKIFNDLYRHGCVPNKTVNIEFPKQIKDNLIRHFVRGFFDGNGSVYRVKKENTLRVSIYSQPKFLERLQIVLKEQAGMSLLKIYEKEKISFVSWSKKEDIKKFYDFIYKDASIFLDRKYKKFLF